MFRSARVGCFFKVNVALLLLLFLFSPLVSAAEDCRDASGRVIYPLDRIHGCLSGSHWYSSEEAGEEFGSGAGCYTDSGTERTPDETIIAEYAGAQAIKNVCDDGNSCTKEQEELEDNRCLCENVDDGPTNGCNGPMMGINGGVCNTHECRGGVCIVKGIDGKPGVFCSGRKYDCRGGTSWTGGCCRTRCEAGEWSDENRCCWDVGKRNEEGELGACACIEVDGACDETRRVGGVCVHELKTPKSIAGASVYFTCTEQQLPLGEEGDDGCATNNYRYIEEEDECVPILEPNEGGERITRENFNMHLSTSSGDPAVYSLGVCGETSRVVCGDGIKHPSETEDNCCNDVPFPDEPGRTGYCSPDGGEMRFCVNNECMKAKVVEAANFEEAWKKWLPMIMLAVLVGYFIAALGFMASSAFSLPELWAWAKAEVGEVSASAWFGAAGISLAVIVNELVKAIGCSAYTLSENCGYLTHASVYLDRLGGEVLRFIGITFMTTMVTGMFSYLGIMPVIDIPIMAVILQIKMSFSPFYGLGLVTQLTMIAANMISFALFSVIIQKVLLEFVAETMFAIFLPLGIFLRCFVITRKMGATIMAVAVGLYVVYPLTLVMNDWVYYQSGAVPRLVPEDTVLGSLPFDPMDIFGLVGPFFGPNFSACEDMGSFEKVFCWIGMILAWPFEVMISAYKMIFMLLIALVMSFALTPGGVAEIFLNEVIVIIPVAVQTMVPALALPVLDFIIVITAIRSLSPAIGGETRIFGLMEFV
ncbi:hypothetical protein HY992_00270 [Candidatus Micrarchaeota archaeon]|nr:hypothetical protein [Candidatus Micrarchaeota archaeon]